MEVPRRDRLNEFFRRVLAAPAAETFDEAVKQLANILTAVQDELTSIPNDPDNWRNDNRLYPPQPDSMREVSGAPQVKRFRSVAHNTCVGANGSIEIVALDGTVELRKAGKDGGGVWELDQAD